MIEIKEISLTDKMLLKEAASLVSKYSWGEDYPIRPISEISKAEYCVGAFLNNELIGFVSLGYSYSPDGEDNDKLWLGHAVIKPAFREQGLFKQLYDKLLENIKKGQIIYACTDNTIMVNFLLTNSWEEYRKTKDEQDNDIIIFKKFAG